MCEVATILGVGALIAGGVSTALNVGGAVAQGNAAAAAGEQAQIQGSRNAMLAGKAADDTVRRGEKQAGLVKLQAGQIMGKQRLTYAASGVDPSNGTPAFMQRATAAISDLDAETIRLNSKREAWGLREQGAEFNAQGYMAMRAGQETRGASYLTAWGHGLGGAAGFGAGLYDFGSKRDWWGSKGAGK